MGVRTRGLDIKAGAAKLNADRAAREEAESVVDHSAAGDWSRYAVVADDPRRPPRRHAMARRFLSGCGTSRAIDLHTLDRHPLASVGTLLVGLRCSWCPGSAPMPKLLGLYALPPANRQEVAL
jgi:hypothetical protein